MGLASHDGLFLSEVQTRRTGKNTDSYFTRTAKWPWNGAFNWGRKERCQHGQIYSEVSYSIYSLVLLDSSWIHIDFSRLHHYITHLKWRQKNNPLHCEHSVSSHPRPPVAGLSHFTHTSPLCWEWPPPRPCLTELSPTPTAMVMTLDCRDLRVYTASSYGLSKSPMGSLHLPSSTSFRPDITGLSKIVWSESMNRLWQDLDGDGFARFWFHLLHYRCL